MGIEPAVKCSASVQSRPVLHVRRFEFCSIPISSSKLASRRGIDLPQESDASDRFRKSGVQICTNLIQSCS